MISLPLFPIWIIDFVGSALVVILALRSLFLVRRLQAREPENAQWLFLYWLTLALLALALSRGVGHMLRHLLVFSGYGSVWRLLQPFSGGLNSISFVVIAAVCLFFHHIQRLYRRMLANHRELEATSREILELNREMEALVMERTMSEMALGVADGIRNPLHIIGGFSHRLLKKAAPDDPVRQWAAHIAREAKRLEQMVARFEALAQRKEAFFRQADLNGVVQETLALIQEEFDQKGIRLEKELFPHPIFARLNAHLLKMALAHLLRNAMDATPPGGHIRVATRVEGHQALLILQDHGRGMTPEVTARVFEPFYTTEVGGTGLGMVFVRQIVEEHRGTITLESEVGQGTTITIRLPLRFLEHPSLSESA